jgi:hypothetical protein
MIREITLKDYGKDFGFGRYALKEDIDGEVRPEGFTNPQDALKRIVEFLEERKG